PRFGDPAPPPGAGGARLHRRGPQDPEERARRRTGRHQRLRVLPDDGDPPGRRSALAGHQVPAAERALLLRLPGQQPGAGPDPDQPVDPPGLRVQLRQRAHQRRVPRPDQRPRPAGPALQAVTHGGPAGPPRPAGPGPCPFAGARPVRHDRPAGPRPFSDDRHLVARPVQRWLPCRRSTTPAATTAPAAAPAISTGRGCRSPLRPAWVALLRSCTDIAPALSRRSSALARARPLTSIFPASGSSLPPGSWRVRASCRRSSSGPLARRAAASPPAVEPEPAPPAPVTSCVIGVPFP